MVRDRQFDARRDLPIAVVIGAGGMSMAIAQRLAQSHRLVLASLDPDQLERAGGRLHEVGAVCELFECDITRATSVQELGRFLPGLGSVTALAHVAALSPSMAHWRDIVNVNLVGAILIEEALRPLMATGGAAVFISSLAAHSPEARPAVLAALDEPLASGFLEQLESAVGGSMASGLGYSLSKLGLNRMVQRQAPAWGHLGARIVSLSPGLIDTPMGNLEDARGGKDSKAQLRSKIPLQRDGTMADIADAVEFLVSRRASYITGIDLLVDGGVAAALRSARGEIN